MHTQMLIGSRFEAGTETAETILNPKTGETILQLPEASAAQIDAAVDAAEKAFKSWSRTTPQQRSQYLLKIADAIEKDAEGFAALEALNCGKPYQCRSERRNSRHCRLLALFRRRGAHHAGAGVGRISAGSHVDDPPRPDRHRRLHRAVELSADDDGLEARAGHCRRQHGRVQAVRADAADRAENGESCWPTSCRRVSSMSCWAAAKASATR